MQAPLKPVTNALIWLGIVFAALIVLLVSSVPVTLEQQLLFAVVSLGFSMLVRLGREVSRYRMIVLIMISVVATGRYVYWRITESMAWFDPTVTLTLWDHFLSIGLLLAEMYAWTVLFLGYFQTIWPLQRKVADLPDDRALWPTVDIFIPTYDEPLKVVAPTVLAAKDIDWPAHKLNVYLLDDGGRLELEQFALQAGIHYIHRDTNDGAKAGNLNNAIKRSHGELIAVFDCDHVPVRAFLHKTVGWFLRDRKLGLVQTPHLFFTPDPVERNLQVFHRVPSEGQLFYGLVQDGNDTWNSAFFCGSCAVIRRDALNEIGGVAQDTVTEDAHTSLLMQKRGWNSAYINTPLAAGMATERLSAHIRQRIRWARGMTQIFRKDNPLFARGLSFAQRITYFNAMMHFFYGLPRIIFLTAPLAYLFFEIYVIQAGAAMIAVYALPHIFQAHVANSAMQGRYRHSFWAEVYETILAPHILFPTLVTFFMPGLGRFNVTAKGGVVEKDHFDWTSSRFIFALLVLNLAGIIVGVLRLFWWNPDETGTVVINLAWTLFNTTIIGAALAVAWEKRQRRSNARIHRHYPALLRTLDGTSHLANTSDISTGDISLKLEEPAVLKRDDYVIVELNEGNQPFRFKGRIATVSNLHVGIRLEQMSAEKLAQLVYFSHGHDAAWERWYNACEPVKPLYSFLEIMRFGLGGAFRAFFGHSDDPENQVRPGYAISVWLWVILIVMLTGIFSPKNANAVEHIFDIAPGNLTATNPVISAPATVTPVAAASDTVAPGGSVPAPAMATRVEDREWRQVVVPFTELGVENPIRLRGGSTQQDVWFSLRADQIARDASVRLKYSLAEELRADYSHLEVSVNGMPVGNLPLDEFAKGQMTEQSFQIDPLYISDINQLSLKLVPREADFCEKLDPKLKEALVSPESEIVMTQGPLSLVNDLSLFPLPFFDRHDDEQVVMPMSLSREMAGSTEAMKAAGIMSSWFGALADYRGASFPVLIDTLPERSGVVFALAGSGNPLLDGFNVTGPGVALVNHPQHKDVKLLVVTGRDAKDLVLAAASITAGTEPLVSDRAEFVQPALPKPLEPYTAPRWLENGKQHRFGELLSADKLTVRGLNPNAVELKFRVPPDLYRWKDETVPLHVTFIHTDLPLRKESNLSLDLNFEGLRSYPLGANKGLWNTATPFPATLPDVRTYQPVYVTQSEKVAMPMYKLIGFNQLTLFHDFQVPEQYGTECINLYTQKLSGTIDPGSYIDLRGFTHFTRLPDLAKFANMGFPFTRYADLAETAVIVPRHPQTAELQTLFELLGRMGAATGYPAYHVSVLFSDEYAQARDKDILLVGGADRDDWQGVWRDHLPIMPGEPGKGWQLRKLGWSERFDLWSQGRALTDSAKVGEQLESSGENLLALTGFQSPFDEGRSVVALLTKDPAKLPTVTRMFNEPARIAQVQHDFAVISGDSVSSSRILPSYHVGRLPFLTGLRWYLSAHLFLLIAVFVALSLITAAVLRFKLRRHAASRLMVRGYSA